MNGPPDRSVVKIERVNIDSQLLCWFKKLFVFHHKIGGMMTLSDARAMQGHGVICRPTG